MGKTYTGLNLLKQLEDCIVPLLLYLLHTTTEGPQEIVPRIPCGPVCRELATGMRIHGSMGIMLDSFIVVAIFEIDVD